MQVTVSSRYRVQIPADVRKIFNIRAGQKIDVVATGSTIHLIPVRDITESRRAVSHTSSEDICNDDN